MKKLVLILIVFVWYSSQAQYILNTTLTTYQELSNPVSLNNGEIWNSGSDYPVFFNFNITIYDQTYTALSVRGGGGLNFPGLGIKELYIFHTPFGGYLLRDKGTSSSLSPIDYEISGDNGQHVLKIQWKNAGFEQWYTSSDTSDFIDFQVWLFEIDNHMEIHFGNHQADPGTYGYPEATNDPNPGPSVLFYFDSCNNVFALHGPSNLPSYWYMNSCTPNYSFIDGTPMNGITYSIYPDNVGLKDASTENLNLYPNPATNWCTVDLPSSMNDLTLIITHISGIERMRIYDIKDKEKIDLTGLQPGLYLYQVIHKKSVISKGKLLKY